MASLFVIYSKYLIILFLAAFLGCGLYGLSFHSVREQGVVANVECVFLFLMQFSAFLTIVLRTQQMRYLILYAFLQVLTLALPVLNDYSDPAGHGKGKKAAGHCGGFFYAGPFGGMGHEVV